MGTGKKDPSVGEVRRNAESPSEKFVAEDSSGVSSWKFVFATLAISAAVYYGLQSRGGQSGVPRFFDHRPPPGGPGNAQGPYAPGHQNAYGTPPPHLTPYSRNVPAKKSPPTRKLSDVPESNGGWRAASKADWESHAIDHCDIDQMSARDITPELFEKEYRFKKPLVIHFPDGADGWTKADLWTLQALLKAYGKWEVGSGKGVDIVRHGGNGHYKSSFEEYVMGIMEERDEHREPFYMFDRNFYNQSALPKSMHPPEYLKISPVLDENIFFLGASMSGVSFHKHADAWNGVVFGWKRWFIYPPTQTPPSGVWPGLNTMQWFSRIYPLLSEDTRPLECMQGPGDIVYLPESWYHGTINLGDTIAIGIQKNIGALHMENLTYTNNRIEDDKSLDPKVKLDKAFEIWKELHERYPTNTEITNRLGENYASRGDFRNAIDISLEAVQRDPYFLVAHMNLGKMYFTVGEPELAEKHFKAAVEINPANSDVCWIYGEFLVFRRRVDDAVKWFKKGAHDHVDKKAFFDNLIHQAEELVRLDPELKSIPQDRPKMMDHSFANAH
ncbi:putative JmjC domain-containing protein 8 [Hypsibius exemplaris]|uniref:JmjC domain-containing protein 8 n=1 Tax=Hypsibius exemplaris TaxID=2072580 RepID=A0A1W0WE58_HYPEX|nr:putative JmjC domain-containing protein 8 [Hypsibius exemplaris]